MAEEDKVSARRQVKLVSDLLNKAGDKNSDDLKGVLDNIAAIGDTAQKTSIINESDKNGNTALHLAVKKKRVVNVELLLKAVGIAVDKENERGETPLWIAAEGILKVNNIFDTDREDNFIDIALKLTAAKADPNKANQKQNKRTPKQLVSPHFVDLTDEFNEAVSRRVQRLRPNKTRRQRAEAKLEDIKKAFALTIGDLRIKVAQRIAQTNNSGNNEFKVGWYNEEDDTESLPYVYCSGAPDSACLLSDYNFSCIACEERRARYVCACYNAVYCSPQCQHSDLGVHAAQCLKSNERSGDAMREFLYALHTANTQSPLKADSLHIGAEAEILKKKLPGIDNALQALEKGNVEVFTEIQQEAAPFFIYWQIIRRTDLWKNNFDKENEYTIFAPDNSAMTSWLRTIGVAAKFDGDITFELKPGKEGQVIAPIDLKQTLDNFDRMEPERKARAVSVLLGHIIPGIHPIFRGFDGGPDPTDPPVLRTFEALAPFFRFDSFTEWDVILDQMPDPEFFLRTYGRIRIIRVEKRRRGQAGLTDFLVTFSFGGADSRLVNKETHILRPNHGYIYRIDEVLGKIVD